MGRRKKAEITEMIEPVEIIPSEEAQDQVAEPEKKEEKSDAKKTRIKKPETEKYKVETSSFLRVREGAGKDKKIIGRYENGDEIESKGMMAVDKDGNKWLKTDLGYCMMDFLKKV